MTKRFTDTDKWKDEWFLELEPLMKMLWLYILDTCDHAGIWRANFKLASYSIGTALDKQSATKALAGKYKDLGRGYWHVPGFITYQYKGKLNPGNKAHLGVINCLKFNGVDPSPFLAPFKELLSQDTFDQRGTGIGTGVGVGVDCINSSSSDFDPRKFLDAKKILPHEPPQDFRNPKGVSPDALIQRFNDALAGKGKVKHCRGLSGQDIQEFLTTTSYSEFTKIETWDEVFQNAALSPFLLGQERSSWVVTLNWLVKHENALKVLNGGFNGGARDSDLDAWVKSIPLEGA